MTKVLAVFGHRNEKVASILPYSGLEYDIRERIEYAPKLPFTVRLLAIMSARLWIKHSPIARYNARNAIKKYNPDIVFTHGGLQTYPLMLETKRAKKKFVMRLGGHVYDEFRENTMIPHQHRMSMTTVFGTHYWFMFENLKNADHIIVVAEDIKKKLCDESGRNSSTISVVPVPIDMDRFDMPKIEHEGYKILTIINLNFMPKVRAIIDFLPAVLTVLRDRGDSKYKLIAPGNYSSRLHSYLPDKLPRNMEVSGFVKDIEREYLGSDIFVYFSYLEGSPNVILEAWASKLPVVTNKTTWSDKLIQHGRTGFLAETEEDARKYIAKLLREKNMREDMAMAGYEYVKDRHCPEVTGRILGEVFRGI